MRIRSIKPEFWKDRVCGRWDDELQLFYIGLWNHADDDGRFEWEPELIRSEIYPYKPGKNVGALLERLRATGRIVAYTVDGARYGYIPRFADHQHPNRPSKSSLPVPTASNSEPVSLNTHGALTESSVSAHGTCSEPSVNGGSVEQLQLVMNTHGALSESSVSTHGTLTAGEERRGGEGRGDICEASASRSNSKPESPAAQQERAVAEEVIAYLNRKAGRTFSASEPHVELVRSRLRDGYTVEDLREVVKCKVREWGDNEEMKRYLRPDTLFNRRKFATYVDEAREAFATQQGDERVEDPLFVETRKRWMP